MAKRVYYPPLEVTGTTTWPDVGCIPNEQLRTGYVFDAPVYLAPVVGTALPTVIVTASVPGDPCTPALVNIRKGMYLYDGSEVRLVTDVKGASSGIAFQVMLAENFTVAPAAVPVNVVEPCFSEVMIFNSGGVAATVNGVTLVANQEFSLNKESISANQYQPALCYDATGGELQISVSL